MYTMLRFPGFLRKAVTLSYDDGVIFDRRLIDIMNQHGLKGTFNINSELFSPAGIRQGRRLTQEKTWQLYSNSGHEIAVHGAKHLSLAAVNTSAVVRDVLVDRENLEKLFGCIIQGMAYANGSYNDEVVDILEKCGIHYSRTTKSTESFDVPTDWLRLPATCHHKNPRLMELAKSFVETTDTAYMWRNRPMLFYLWGHSYEFNDDDNWDVIEEFAAYIGNRPDIWYATNGQIYDYVQAFTRLQYSADGSLIYNPSSCDVYLNYYKKEIIVPAGKTVAGR